jgi:hypothetical protein
MLQYSEKLSFFQSLSEKLSAIAETLCAEREMKIDVCSGMLSGFSFKS